MKCTLNPMQSILNTMSWEACMFAAHQRSACFCHGVSVSRDDVVLGMAPGRGLQPRFARTAGCSNVSLVILSRYKKQDEQIATQNSTFRSVLSSCTSLYKLVQAKLLGYLYTGGVVGLNLKPVGPLSDKTSLCPPNQWALGLTSPGFLCRHFQNQLLLPAVHPAMFHKSHLKSLSHIQNCC